MSQQKLTTLAGTVTIVDTPDQDECIPNTLQGLLKELEKHLAVRLPVSTNSTTVVKGFDTPGVSDRNKIWFQFSPTNDPLAIRYFKDGEWLTMIDFVTEGKLMIGDPLNIFPPSGWQYIVGSEQTFGGQKVYFAKRVT